MGCVAQSETVASIRICFAGNMLMLPAASTILETHLRRRHRSIGIEPNVPAHGLQAGTIILAPRTQCLRFSQLLYPSSSPSGKARNLCRYNGETAKHLMRRYGPLIEEQETKCTLVEACNEEGEQSMAQIRKRRQSKRGKRNKSGTSCRRGRSRNER